MSETPPEFDLKFLPDWLKESAGTKKYENFEGPSPREMGERSDRRERRGPGGPRPGGGDRRPKAPGAPQGRGPRRDGPRGERDRGPRREQRDDRPREPRPTAPPPAPVKIEFLPEPGGALSIAKQIKQSGRAYPLFGTGRLFLERPERHLVRITSLDPAQPLHQFGDGPVSFNRAAVEHHAFITARSQYYKEEILEGEPIKGNFKNVAKLRGGTFLGPTNYHSYQPALRRIYEERFSRRMSFAEFTQNEVQIVTDEQSINDWKEQARSVTTYVTLQEETPTSFKTVPEVEAHFREHYLPQLIKTGTVFEITGQASRELPDRMLFSTVRDAWERERGFPVNLVNQLRSYLVEAGLHFFKHRKRILYIAAVKPVRYVTGQAISSGIEAILNAVEEHPRGTRRDLAVRILGEGVEAPEMVEQKEALARDFLYLVHAGHVIEFHDGAIDLPLIPGGQKGAAKETPAEENAESEAERAVLAEAAAAPPVTKRTEPPVPEPARLTSDLPPAVDPATFSAPPEEPSPGPLAEPSEVVGLAPDIEHTEVAQPLPESPATEAPLPTTEFLAEPVSIEMAPAEIVALAPEPVASSDANVP